MPTPNYNWPTPTTDDAPAGPMQIGALGNAIDAFLAGTDAAINYGTGVGTVGNGTTVSKSGATVFLDVEFTVTSNRAAGDTLFTIAPGCRPGAPKPLVVAGKTLGNAITLEIGIDGAVRSPVALASGSSLYGGRAYRAA